MVIEITSRCSLSRPSDTIARFNRDRTPRDGDAYTCCRNPAVAHHAAKSTKERKRWRSSAINAGTPLPCYRDFEEALHVVCSDTPLWRKYQFIRRATGEFIERIGAKQGRRVPPAGGGRRGEESDQAAIVELEREQT